MQETIQRKLYADFSPGGFTEKMPYRKKLNKFFGRDLNFVRKNNLDRGKVNQCLLKKKR